MHDARERSWYATTPYGIAVLRYAEMNKLLKSRQLRQGSIAWPAHNGVTERPVRPVGGPAGCSTRRARSTAACAA